MIAAAFLSLAVLVAAFGAVALCVSKSRSTKRGPASPAQDSKLSTHQSSKSLVAARPSDSALIEMESPRDSLAGESPLGHSSKFISRFSSKRASATSMQSTQSENHSGDGVVSEGESDNDRISEEEDQHMRNAHLASARRRSSEFDRESLNNGDFASGPTPEVEDTGRAAAMAMRLMANLRGEQDERKRLQAILENTNKHGSSSGATGSGVSGSLAASTGANTNASGSSTNSPAVQRSINASFGSPGGSPFGSRSSTMVGGGLRPLSQEFGIAYDARPNIQSTLPPLRANSLASPFKVKYIPEPGPTENVLPTGEPIDMREKLKDARRKLRPVSKGDEGEFSQCTFLGDCQCGTCR